MDRDPDVSNRQIVVLITRFFIRHITRLFGYYNATVVLSKLIYILNKSFHLSFDNHSLYIIQINFFRNTCFYLFNKGDVLEHARYKKKWAKFVIINSKDSGAIENATEYLAIINGCKLHEGEFTESVNSNKDTFYIYGPNSDSEPLDKYNNSVLVLTKPVDKEVSIYKDSKLFLNSYYFNKFISNDKKRLNKLQEKYGCVYVSCMHVNLDGKIKRVGAFKAGNISSPMALGRGLATLIQEYGKINCVIHGFDFYLTKKSYNSRYPSSMISKNGAIDNQQICESLIEHDALYNFLYVKGMANMLNILESEKFTDIINLTGREYMDKLINIRDCSNV